MEQYKNIEAVFSDFMKKEVEYIDAIQILMDQFHFTGKEAEDLVESWEA